MSAPSSPVAAPEPPGPVLPRIELRYEGLRYGVKLQAQQQARAQLPSVFRTISNVALALPRRLLSLGAPAAAAGTPAARDFAILDDVSGVIKPGTLTLLLAPPGHGKSAFLKALTQMLPAGELKGSITYSGVSAAEAPAKGVYLGSLCQYVNQVDEHLPQLTVRETFEFIRDNAAVDPSKHGFPHLAAAHAEAVDDIVTLLSLKNCEKTIIGNDLVRGVSGGEKKRVTVGEGLLTNARALALDEISTGLDSAVTFDICKRLRERASQQGLTVVTSLLQPTPETFGLFDDVILIREGAVVYHGARAALPAYLASLGFTPPTAEDAAAAMATSASATSLSKLAPSASGTSLDRLADGAGASLSPSGSSGDLAGAASASGAEDRGKDALSLDLADWLVQMLSDPAKVLASTEAAASPEARSAALSAAGGRRAPTTTAELAARWKESAQFKAMMGSAPSAPPLALEGSFAVAQYSKPYAHSFAHHQRLLLGRQMILMSRNLLYVRSRIMSACVMSIILGGLYYQRSTVQGAAFMGTFLNCMMTMGFANLSEMAAAVENKYIAYRQVANGAYPGTAYVAASAITHIPVAITECFIFTGIIYGMSGMGESSSPGAYFFLWGIVVLFDLIMRNLLVMFALRGKSLQMSQAAPLPIIAMMIIFGGFLVTKDKMGWLTFVSYIDPINWGLHALSLNEFGLDRYKIAAGPGAAVGTDLGGYFLNAFGMDPNMDYKWGGLGFMFGFLAFVCVLEFRSFSAVRFDRNIGSLFAKYMALNRIYLAQFPVDDMLFWFRARAGDPSPPGKSFGWDDAGFEGGYGLRGSVAGAFMMGAGGHVRWANDSALWAALSAVVEGVRENQQADGFAMAFAQADTHCRENPDYVTSWMTHGLLEAAGAGLAVALDILRKHYDWFSYAQDELAQFLPPLGGPNVSGLPWPGGEPPDPYGAPFCRRDLQTNQGMVHNSRLALSPVGTMRDAAVVADIYAEEWWLQALAARDPKAVWYRHYYPHNYEITAWEAFADMAVITGDPKWLAAVDGAWDMLRASWLHVGGSVAINEAQLYPPGSYFLEPPNPDWQHPTPLPTGELCGSSFWVKLNQRLQRLRPDAEAYAGEIERSLLNVVLAAISGDGFGIRYFARLHQHKDGASNVSTCCEGQGTREFGALPEYVFSTSSRGVHVHLYQAATLSAPFAGGQLAVAIETQFPYASDVAISVGAADGTPPPAAPVSLLLRVPAWCALPVVNISVTDAAGAETFVAGERGTYAEIALAPAALPAAVRFALPMALRSTLYEGYDQIGTSSRYALELGPVLLAAVGPLTNVSSKDAAVVLPAALDPSRPEDWLAPVAGAPLHFSVAGAPDVTYAPYFEIQDESFDVFPVFGAWR